MNWTGHVALIGDIRNLYKISVRKSEGKIPLGISGRKWEDNIKTSLKSNRAGIHGLGGTA
jgi:hypothetical protein